jgi:putative membrane protein
MMDWYGGGWGGWLLMSLMMLGFWVLAAIAAMALWRWSRQEQQRSTDSARDVLDDRLARGEISEADYLRKRDLLSSRR